MKVSREVEESEEEQEQHGNRQILTFNPVHAPKNFVSAWVNSLELLCNFTHDVNMITNSCTPCLNIGCVAIASKNSVDGNQQVMPFRRMSVRWGMRTTHLWYGISESDPVSRRYRMTFLWLDCNFEKKSEERNAQRKRMDGGARIENREDREKVTMTAKKNGSGTTRH